MREDRVHLMTLQDVVKRIYLKILTAHRKMISNRIELNPVDRFLELESFDRLESPVINHIHAALFPSWQDVVALASHSIDIRFVKILYLLAKAANSQVPNSDFTILPSRDTYFIIFKGNILDLFVALQYGKRSDDIRRENWSKLSFNWSTLNVK